MKALQLNNYSKQFNIKLVDIPTPSINSDEVLIKVKAAALNPLDILIARGDIKLIVNYSLPLILGNEFSGIVEKVGPSVSNFKVGDYVYSRLPIEKIGAFSEYISVKASALALMPKDYDFKTAAAIPLTGLTAYQALVDILKVKSGQTVLITGGSGSFGQMAVPLAKSLGINTIVTGNKFSKEEFLKLGANQYICYESEDYSKIIKNVDYVIDTLGISEFTRELSVLKTHGKILSLRGMPNKSFAERYKIKGFRKLLFTIAGQKYDKLAKKQGKSYEFMFVKENGEELKYITKIVEDNKIHPATDSNEWKIDNFEEALNYFNSKKAKGKIVFTFD